MFVFCIRLFEANEDIKKHLNKFSELDNATLIKSELLVGHAHGVMAMIDETIIGLDDAELTHQKLKNLGVDHRERHITASLIDEIREPFLRSVEQTLDHRYTEHMRSIYECFIEYMLRAIKEGYDS